MSFSGTRRCVLTARDQQLVRDQQKVGNHIVYRNSCTWTLQPLKRQVASRPLSIAFRDNETRSSCAHCDNGNVCFMTSCAKLSVASKVKASVREASVREAKILGEAKYFTLSKQQYFVLGHRLSKHKTTRYARNLGESWYPCSPGTPMGPITIANRRVHHS